MTREEYECDRADWLRRLTATHPGASLLTYTKHLGMSREGVRQLALRNGIELSKARRKPRTEPEPMPLSPETPTYGDLRVLTKAEWVNELSSSKPL